MAVWVLLSIFGTLALLMGLLVLIQAYWPRIAAA